jgi:hypothetical protein
MSVADCSSGRTHLPGKRKLKQHCAYSKLVRAVHGLSEESSLTTNITEIAQRVPITSLNKGRPVGSASAAHERDLDAPIDVVHMLATT